LPRMDSASKRRVGNENDSGTPCYLGGKLFWAALSLVTFFIAVDKESNSPAGRNLQYKTLKIS